MLIFFSILLYTSFFLLFYKMPNSESMFRSIYESPKDYEHLEEDDDAEDNENNE